MTASREDIASVIIAYFLRKEISDKGLTPTAVSLTTDCYLKLSLGVNRLSTRTIGS